MGFLFIAAVVAVIVIVVRKRNDEAWAYSARSGLAGGDGGSPSGLQAKLDEWVGASLIDRDEAQAVLSYEREHAAPRASRVPLLAEAVGYIGGGLVLAAGALLVGNRWEEIGVAERLLSIAVPTAVAAIGGWWVGRRDEPALQRLGSALWLLAEVGVAGVATVVWIDVVHDGDPSGRHGVLFVAGLTLVLAAAAWWVRRTELQQLGLLAAAVATSVGVLATVSEVLDRDVSAVGTGMMLIALGIAWAVAGLEDRMPPAVLSVLAGSGLMLVGAQFVRAESDHLGLWLGLAASVALLGAGVVSTELALLLMGAAGLFQWTPQVALFYLEDTFGAEVTLLLIGSLLIAVAGASMRFYPKLVSDRQAEASDAMRPALLVALICAGALVVAAVAAQVSAPKEFERSFADDDVLDRAGEPFFDENVEGDVWAVTPTGPGGRFTVAMIHTFETHVFEGVDDIGGRLVWDEAEIGLCNVHVRSVGENRVQIGDIFSTFEECESAPPMPVAFRDHGIPGEACVYFATAGMRFERCEELEVRDLGAEDEP